MRQTSMSVEAHLARTEERALTLSTDSSVTVLTVGDVIHF